jgi:multidrug efflux pump subunit AcrA (membrane-fusion protein)
MGKLFKDILIIVLLLVSALGILCLVLQNFGIIPIAPSVQVVNEVSTYINGGSVDVNGTVDVGNTVDVYVEGGQVATW